MKKERGRKSMWEGREEKKRRSEGRDNESSMEKKEQRVRKERE